MTVLAVCLIAGAAGTARSDDWPVVRGDNLGSGVATQAIPDKLEVLWTYRAGEEAGFEATPVVVGDVVYVGDNMGVFHAVNRADGKPLWTKAFEDTGFGAGAAIDKDRIYVGDLNGIVRCLSTKDGSEIWDRDVKAEVYAGPALLGDDILVTSEAGTLTCFHAADGAQRWQFTIEAPLRCTPTVSNGRVMLAGCDSKLHFIDVASGNELTTVDIDGPTGATPAVAGERVYFGTEGGTFFAIDASIGDGQQPSVAWTYRDPRRGQPIRAAAAVTDQLVVYGSHGKSVYGLDPKSGEPIWNLPTRTRIESSPVIAGERVVAATANGILYVLDLAGKVVSQYEAGGSFTGSPAVVDGQIIIGNGDGTLYCFGTKSESKNESATEDTEVIEKSK